MNDEIYQKLADKRVIEFEELKSYLEKLGMPKEDLNFIEKAYEIAKKMHGEKKRKTGEYYYTHPVHVAWNYIHMGICDRDGIAAALLHDTVEDTPYTLEEIARDFNPTVAMLVDTVTKVDLEELTREAKKKATIQKLLYMIIFGDIRGFYIKVGDRLHNMATLEGHKPDKREEIANETMDAYVPVTKGLGAHQVSNVLKDLSLMYTKPDTFQQIVELKNNRYITEKENLLAFQNRLQTVLQKAGIKGVSVVMRDQTIHNLYRKLEGKEINEKNFAQINDVFYFKVVADNMQEVSRALSIINAFCDPVAGTLKDYSKDPHGLFYRNISEEVCYNKYQFKVKIRTEFADKLACFGLPYYWTLVEQDNIEKMRDGTQHMLLRQPAFQKMCWLLEQYKALPDETWDDMEKRYKEFYAALTEFFNQHLIIVYVYSNERDEYVRCLIPESSTILDVVNEYGGADCCSAQIDGVDSTNPATIVPPYARIVLGQPEERKLAPHKVKSIFPSA